MNFSFKYKEINKAKKFILWFKEISKDDIELVGGKNANLWEMYQILTKAQNTSFPDEKIQVPYGFAVTAYAYRYFIEKNNLDKLIRDLLTNLDTAKIHDLENAGKHVRNLIISAKFPQELEHDITEAYFQ